VYCRRIMVRQSNSGSSRESKELVVYSILRDSTCNACGKELWKGDFLFMEGGHPLCLSCADFDHLVYLPRGDAALTRRARRHSPLNAVVVRFRDQGAATNVRASLFRSLRSSAPNKNALRMVSSARDSANGMKCAVQKMIAISSCT